MYKPYTQTHTPLAVSHPHRQPLRGKLTAQRILLPSSPDSSTPAYSNVKAAKHPRRTPVVLESSTINTEGTGRAKQSLSLLLSLFSVQSSFLRISSFAGGTINTDGARRAKQSLSLSFNSLSLSSLSLVRRCWKRTTKSVSQYTNAGVLGEPPSSLPR